MKLFRVARILKFCYTSKGMKGLLAPLMISILHLPDVLLYLLVLVFAFGIIGTFQYQGSFYYRCRTTPEPINGVWEIDRDIPRFCSAYGYGDFTCPSNRYCGHPDMYGLSLKSENASYMIETYYNAVGYDMVIKAVLAHIQILTMEGWCDLMYKVSDTMNSVFARLFFPVFIYVCAFFTLNLIVAVIVDSLLKSKQQVEEEESKNVPIEDVSSKVEFPKDSVNQPSLDINAHDNDERYRDKEVAEVAETERAMLRNNYKGSSKIVLPIVDENEAKTPKTPVTPVIEVKVKDTKHTILNTIVIIVVLAEIVTMCLDRLGVSETEVQVIDWIDTVFFALFILEMLIKMYVEGICNYFSNGPSNIMDIIINIFGIVELCLTHSSVSMNYYWRGVIVVLRVTRVLKLVDKLTILKETLSFIWMTLSDIINFMVLLALFVFIYTVIGMELFAGKVKFNGDDMLDIENGESPMYNFDSLQNALIASYSLVIGDSWSSYLYPYTRVHYTIGVIYFYTGVYMLNVFLVNVFLAIILQNFYVDEQKKKWEEEEKKNLQYTEQLKRRRTKSPSKEYKNRETVLLTALKIFRTVISLNKMCKERKKKIRGILTGNSLSLLNYTNKFRVISHHIVSSTVFFIVSYIFSIAITVIITFQTPLYDPEGAVSEIIYILSVILLVFFLIELLLNMVCYGIIANGEESYLRNPWNVIDAISTLALVLHVSLRCTSGTILGRILMIIVVMRIFRVTTVREGFKLSLQAIIKGFPSILSVLGVGTLFFFILSVIGIHFFKGMLHYCDKTNLSENTGLKSFDEFDCMNYGGEWRNTDVSFDNIFISFLTLFELMTAKSWWLLVTELSKSYGVNKNDRESNNYGTSWFLIICTIVGFLYIRAIITGLINFAFCNEKEEIQGVKNLKYLQRKWVNFSKVIFKAAPIKKYKSDCKFYRIYQIITHRAFELTITLTVIVNGIVLCIYHFRAPTKLITACDAICVICTCIYAIEAFLKILFYRTTYFSDGWNVFDFVCLWGIIIFEILFLIIDVSENPIAILNTLFRVAKLLSLFRLLKVLKRMFQTTVLAFPSALNLAVLIIIMNYIFAVVGVIFFSTVKFQNDLNANANYKDLLTGFLTTFRIASGDNWCAVVHDLMQRPTQYFDCVSFPSYESIHANGDKTNGCGGVDGAIYSILLVLVVNFIFLNLFVAIVVASMLEISELSESVLSDDILNKYQQVWSNYDPDALGLIEYCNIWDFLCDLRKPLGICKEDIPNSYYAAITLWMLDLKIHYVESKTVFYVEFYDVLEALVKKSIYRPQTLDKIFHNDCKDDLIDGLQELWSQKSSLLIEDQEDLGKIEALNYYYKAKEASAKKGMLQLKKAQLPLLVWVTLRIMRTLKLMVRERKLRAGELTDAIPVVDNKESNNLQNSNVDELTKVKNKPIKVSIPSFSINGTSEYLEHDKKPSSTQLNNIPVDDNKNIKISTRLVEKKIPHNVQKVNIKTYTEQINLQNFLNSLNKGAPRISSKNDTSGSLKNELNNSKGNGERSKYFPISRILADKEGANNRLTQRQNIIANPKQRKIVIRFNRAVHRDDSD